MKNILTVLAIATLTAASPALASVYSVSFTGTVDQVQGATGQAIGNTVTGHFDLNSTTGNFLDFTIAGKSVAAGFLSTAAIVPALTEAIYTAQVSPVALGTQSNSSFSLDLSSLTSWPASDSAFTLLSDTNQLTTNLDTVNNPMSAFPSTFNYYTANANGTNVVSLGANLTSITVQVIPEPSSFLLFGVSMLGFGFLVRRQKA